MKDLLNRIVRGTVADVTKTLVLGAILALPVQVLINLTFSDLALVTVFGGSLTLFKAFAINSLVGMIAKVITGFGSK